MLIKKLTKYHQLIQFKRLYSNRNILRLKERNMFQDLFPDTALHTVTDLLNAKPACVYAGFDPTADSLHIGNLLVLINLLHWQRGGHQPIALIGGATAKIGDPSGRTNERDQLSANFINENVMGIEKNIRKIFENHQKYFWNDPDPLPLIKIVNNDEWYSKMSAITLIGNIGRKLRMGTLLSRTSVQTRLKSTGGMSFTEFSYQLFQAYDWLHLYQNYGCSFQIGGNDQMGNIMSGHELISKTCKKPVYGLTVPLITTEMGDKYGKSAGNAMWLNPIKTTPFTLYQYFIRTSDADVEKLLKLFTFESMGFITDLMRQHWEKPEQHLAQRKLAENLVRLVHGDEGLASALQASRVLYEGHLDELKTLDIERIIEIFQGATVVDILPEAGMTILDLAMKAQCFPTKSDANRIINAGGFYLNQQKIQNSQECINLNLHQLVDNLTILRVGKKNYYIIKWLK